MYTKHLEMSWPGYLDLIHLASTNMAASEEEFACLPGARLINRYMLGTSLEKRERALQNLRVLLMTLMPCALRVSGQPAS